MCYTQFGQEVQGSISQVVVTFVMGVTPTYYWVNVGVSYFLNVTTTFLGVLVFPIATTYHCGTMGVGSIFFGYSFASCVLLFVVKVLQVHTRQDSTIDWGFQTAYLHQGRGKFGNFPANTFAFGPFKGGHVISGGAMFIGRDFTRIGVNATIVGYCNWVLFTSRVPVGATTHLLLGVAITRFFGLGLVFMFFHS